MYQISVLHLFFPSPSSSFFYVYRRRAFRGTNRCLVVRVGVGNGWLKKYEDPLKEIKGN